MNLWLDDVRDPCKHGAIGFDWAKTYDEAITALKRGDIEFASLDHDIGACADCTAKMLHIGDMLTPETTFYNRCPHEKTGYDKALSINNLERGTYEKGRSGDRPFSYVECVTHLTR
jgi:hypothetical protein